MNSKGQMLSTIIIILLVLVVITSSSLQSINIQDVNNLNLITQTTVTGFYISSNINVQHIILRTYNASNKAISTFNNEINLFLKNYYPTYTYNGSFVSGNGITLKVIQINQTSTTSGGSSGSPAA